MQSSWGVMITFVIVVLTILRGMKLAKEALKRADRFITNILAQAQRLAEDLGSEKVIEAWVRTDCVPFLTVIGLRLRQARDGVSLVKLFSPEADFRPQNVVAIDILKRLIGRRICLSLDYQEVGALCGVLRHIQEKDEDVPKAQGTMDEIPVHPEDEPTRNTPFYIENVDGILVLE